MGTRIREASEKLPKPLIEIGGKPILWHIMKTYGAHGFRRFVLCLGYKGEQIRKFFLSTGSSTRDFTVNLGSGGSPSLVRRRPRPRTGRSPSSRPASRPAPGARVKRVAEYLDQPYFLLTYGDGIGIGRHRRPVPPARRERARSDRDGRAPDEPVRRDARHRRRVTEFNEKPTMADGWVSGGFFAFKREMVDRYLDDDPICCWRRSRCSARRRRQPRGLQARGILDGNGHVPRLDRAQPALGLRRGGLEGVGLRHEGPRHRNRGLPRFRARPRAAPRRARAARRRHRLLQGRVAVQRRGCHAADTRQGHPPHRAGGSGGHRRDRPHGGALERPARAVQPRPDQRHQPRGLGAPGQASPRRPG